LWRNPVKIELRQQSHFDAAHELPQMPEGHKCRRLHGHRYTVTIAVQGEPCSSTGILIDYLELRERLDVVLGVLDHRYLNDIAGLETPTVENLCKWIWVKLCTGKLRKILCAVEVQETPTASCVYRGE
jgi:6-pyruvoyltetrahydropterin/6-carboxytetrahydropterin synthase